MAAGFDEEKKGKRRVSVFVVVEFKLIFCHPCINVICACTEFCLYRLYVHVAHS